jgi:hypothetical protein
MLLSRVHTAAVNMPSADFSRLGVVGSDLGSEPTPVDHVSILVDHAVVAPDISQVNADG